MQNLWWICWFIWESLPALTAHPVSGTNSLDTNDTFKYYLCWSCHWEQYWLRYTIGLLSITIAAFTLVGCLCCRRHRRPKGFQERGGKRKQAFKDGSTIGHESTFENALGGLELGVSRTAALVDRVQFEPLPVERFIPNAKTVTKPKRLPPSPSLFNEEHEQNQSTLQKSCHEWFDAVDRQLPREKLKYLREIGRGWFGKVVEGRADLDNSNGISKNDSVVVRILTEEATIKEKAWFLGEARPYLKLQHHNILALLGFCLETDPYLLLFESCPSGDLKGFLQSNRDLESQKALVRENIPLRMAVDIAFGLQHMHINGFAHTDLSARNCLIASDLSAKLGDYGIGVEKYPNDYYVIGDRALPIRWSAPESLECTESTIETREITLEANIWSYAVLLWEIATWGERPYDDLGDEQVIEMLVSLKLGFNWAGSQLLLRHLGDCSSNLCDAIRLCWNLDPDRRSTLEEVRRVLLRERSGTEDFEQRWKNLRPNISKGQVRSASLQDLRGSVDSDCWPSIEEEKSAVPPTSFRLGPGEPVKNIPGSKNNIPLQESGSETEEESWRGRVERGAYTEKVRQKSKSVADLMVLVHIDSDSDAEWSMGAQTSEKTVKKKLAATSSDSDLRSAVLADEFDETLRKLRDPLQNNSLRGVKFPLVPDRSKLLTLTTDQEQTPILRLSFEPKEADSIENDQIHNMNTNDTGRIEEHVLRLVSKGDPNLHLLRYIPDHTSHLDKSQEMQESQTINSFLKFEKEIPCFSNNFSISNLEENHTELVDVALWNHALDTALEQKVPGFLTEGDFKEEIESHLPKYSEETTPKLVVTTASAPGTPHSQGNSSIGNGEDDFSNIDELEMERKALPNEIEEEEDRKRLSTPDDERSSDSGFRDKESCEEEEGPLPYPPHPPPPLPSPTFLFSNSLVSPSIPLPMLAEEEQLRILSELDAILDAEYCETLDDSEKLAEDVSSDRVEIKLTKLEELVSDSYQNVNLSESEQQCHLNSDILDEKEKSNVECKKIRKLEENESKNEENESKYEEKCKKIVEEATLYDREESLLKKINIDTKVNLLPDSTNSLTESVRQPDKVTLSSELQRLDNESAALQIDHYESLQESESNNENEEEDSSTVSLRSDNSYVSFGMEEEFVAAIRNELREKLPKAQMSVVEAPELHDEDEPSIIGNLMDSERWDDDCENSSENGDGVVDISIRYNVYGTPLSPILEERESVVTSESLISKDDSRDVSIISKETVPSEDLLLVDTQTNKAVLLEGSDERNVPVEEDDRNTSNGDITDEENLEYSTSDTLSSRRLDNESRIMMGGGGAPLPSPEDELKWQQLPQSSPLPLQLPQSTLPLSLQEGVISTSFATEHDWDSQDEEGEGEDEEEEEDEEENSSSSGEFVWKRYDEQVAEMKKIDDIPMNKTVETDGEIDAEEEAEDEDEEEEFTPSAWNATLAPHRSALRSPDKTQKSGDQKKSVWFKKQRYHCVYEYPKETPSNQSQGQTATTWEPTSYADWEEMMDEPKLDMYSIDYDEADHVRDEEFYVSSSSRPFQFQTGDGKYVSQFFPGATSALLQQCQQQEEEQQEEGDQQQQQNNNNHHHCSHRDNEQQYQLGELRHTRDRLKLNLSSSNGTSTVLNNPMKQGKDNENSRIDFLANKVSETSETILTENQTVSVNATKAMKDEEENLVYKVELSDETVKKDNAISTITKLYPSDNQGNETCNILVND